MTLQAYIHEIANQPPRWVLQSESALDFGCGAFQFPKVSCSTAISACERASQWQMGLHLFQAQPCSHCPGLAGTRSPVFLVLEHLYQSLAE